MKFSIIMPNYNNEKWLEKCLGSALRQSYKNYEIIFVDDMSTDKSREIAKELLREEDTYVELKTKRYNGGARNEAIIRATGDYLVFLDSDDWFEDNYVLHDYNRALQSNAVDVMFVNLYKQEYGIKTIEWNKVYKDKYEAMASLHGGACLKVIKRELAQRPECLYNEGTLQEDRNHHSRICYYMKTFSHLDRFGSVYNKDNRSSTTKVRDKARWGTAPYRNYADAKQFLIEITPDGDERAIAVMEKRVERIRIDLDKTDYQH